VVTPMEVFCYSLDLECSKAHLLECLVLRVAVLSGIGTFERCDLEGGP
jgi:hypothetical protein